MPIDYSHQHLSTSILKVDDVHTPIDPSGGGGNISATDGTTTVANVTTLQSGIVVAGGAGVALTGTAVISPTDPGAIGAGNLWMDSASGTNSIYPLFVRDPSNAYWIQASLGDTLSTDGPIGGYSVVDVDGNVLVNVHIDTNAGHGQYSADAFSAGNNSPDSQVTLNPDHAKLVHTGAGPGYAITSVSVEDIGTVVHGALNFDSLATSDPGIAGQVYSDGAPSAGVPKALMVSGG
jgi:hypothetical protein